MRFKYPLNFRGPFLPIFFTSIAALSSSSAIFTPTLSIFRSAPGNQILQNEEIRQIFLRPEFRERLHFSRRVDGSPISLIFDLKTEYPFENTLYENNKNNLVMVSTSRYTVSGKALRESPYAVAVFSPSSSYYDYIIMDPPSVLVRDQIAQIAHGDIGFCGAMVPVEFGFSSFPEWYG